MTFTSRGEPRRVPPRRLQDTEDVAKEREREREREPEKRMSECGPGESSHYLGTVSVHSPDTPMVLCGLLSRPRFLGLSSTTLTFPLFGCTGTTLKATTCCATTLAERHERRLGQV
ncbi:hypothetical protein LY78DRAFT_393597 [Colletotrichum sublineola]|nr:hypothetical protein LY78DRAFT_393597 [Colletotrichum sublineola]